MPRQAPTSGGSGPLLKVDGLRVHFRLPRSGLLSRHRDVIKAVDGLSFTLNPGETLGIVGESGCGKSTLGRAVLRLIPSTEGRVLWLGEDLTALSGERVRPYRREMQIIFQDPLASLNPRMTVGEIIAEPLRTFEPRITAEDMRGRVRDLMATVGLLPEMINRYPHEFSGGQCQRIGIARAMILRPRLIVCDEPVSALDVSIQSQILNLLIDLQRRFGLSLIFISHDLSVVRHVSHRIMVLYMGRMMEMADREDLYERPRHPYTQALISAVPLPDPDAERGKARILLQGDIPSPINPPSGCVFRTRCPKAAGLCADEVPATETVTAGHRVACHFWEHDAPR